MDENMKKWLIIILVVLLGGLFLWWLYKKMSNGGSDNGNHGNKGKKEVFVIGWGDGGTHGQFMTAQDAQTYVKAQGWDLASNDQMVTAYGDGKTGNMWVSGSAYFTQESLSTQDQTKFTVDTDTKQAKGYPTQGYAAGAAVYGVKPAASAVVAAKWSMPCYDINSRWSQYDAAGTCKMTCANGKCAFQG